MTAFIPLPPLLAAASVDMPAETEPHVFTPSLVEPALLWTVEVGVVLIILGIILCLYRLLRGPHLADRVLAADALSLHVVGLVILLSIVLSSTTFFDAVLVIAILGFVSTVGFSQYICGLCERREAGDPDAQAEPLTEDPVADAAPDLHNTERSA